MLRYLAFAWNPGSVAQTATVRTLRRQARLTAPEWRQVLNANGLSVFVTGCRAGQADVYDLQGDQGVVLGAFFRRSLASLRKGDDARSDEPPQSPLSAVETARILDSKGRRLIDAYWGRYVAFLIDARSGRKWVLREPTGNLPCYFTVYQGVTLLFSSISDCLRISSLEFTINWRQLAIHASGAPGYSAGAALNEVRELCGGECLEIKADCTESAFYWRPLQFVRSDAIERESEAAALLRETLKSCVHGWSSRYSQIVHQLSGGLDSSIVLGCLADAPARPRITCVTYYVPGYEQDGRPLARLAAKRAGGEYVECPRDSSLPLSVLLESAPPVDPQSNIAFVETSRLVRNLVQQTNATAVLDGIGGDYLFQKASRHLIAADYTHQHGVDRNLLRIASNVAPSLHRSLWAVLLDAVRTGLFRKPSADPAHTLRYRKLVRREVVDAVNVAGGFTHPWLHGCEEGPPGTTIMLLTLTKQFVPFYDPLRKPADPWWEPVSPLLSQPVVEICLRIPSYVHNLHGHDRGLQRLAFRLDVPSEILDRRYKDRAPGFANELLMANLEFIREMLLDGVLVKQAVLDRASLEAALSGSPSKQGAFPLEVFEHLATEIWARYWTDRSERRVASLNMVSS